MKFSKHLLAIAVTTLLTLNACDNGEQTNVSNTTTQSTMASASTNATSNERYVNEFAQNLPANAQEVIVATQPKNPPFEFKNEQGNIIGFDADIISAIGADQGLKMTIIDTKWDGIFDGLQEKKYQVVIGSMGDTPERRAKFSLSDVYAYAPNSIVVPADSKIKDANDLNGKTVSMITGSSTPEDLAAKNIKVTEAPVSSTYLALTTLVDKKADAAIVDKLVAAYSLKNMNFPTNILPFQSEEEGAVVFAAHKDDAALIEKINTGLANIKKNGIYDEIYKKWFGDVLSDEKAAASTAK